MKEELVENKIFVCGLLTGAAKDATPPNFGEKTNSHKTSKFIKIFYIFFESFPLYANSDLSTPGNDISGVYNIPLSLLAGPQCY